jgi:hypothetical protein
MIAWYHRTAFVLGLLALVLGVGAGLYGSLVRDHRLPPLVFQNMTEIEALMDAREHDEAIERLGMTLELVPGQRRFTHNMLGNALAAKGRHAEAIAQYRLALELDPTFAEAHNNLGVALARSGALPEALGELARAVELGPDDESAWGNLAHAVRTAETRGLEAGDPSSAPTLARARTLLIQSGRRPAAPPALSTAAPDPLDSPAARAARRFADQFLASDLETLHASFGAELAERMPLDELRELRARVEADLGVEVERLRERIEPRAGANAYSRVSRFDRFGGLVELALVLEPDGTIASFRLRTGEVASPDRP